MESHTGIRIGTLVRGNQADPVRYLEQVLPYGFESFQLFYWQTLGGADLPGLARRVRDALAGSGAVISSLGIFGNPLEAGPEDRETLRGWEECIDHAREFGCDLVCGFTGRLRGKPIPDSLPRFREIFGDLARRAADRGVRIGFENCEMGGSWQSGDWNLAHNPAAWELLFDALPAANLGLEWEPCHQMCQLIEPIPQLRRWTPRIFHVHGKCATIRPDIIREYGIHGPEPWAFHRHPGFGDCNWTDVISELRRHGFRGCIDIEGWHDPVYRDDLELTGQVASLAYLKRCRGGEFVPNPA